MLCFNRTAICDTDVNKQVGKLSFTPVAKKVLCSILTENLCWHVANLMIKVTFVLTDGKTVTIVSLYWDLYTF